MQFLWFAIILRVHPPFHPSFHSHLLTRPTRVIMCAVKLQKQTRSRVDSGQWIWGKQGWIVAIYMKYELVSRKGHKLNRGRVGVETWGSEQHLSLFSDADTISTISMSTIVALDKPKRLIWMVINFNLPTFLSAIGKCQWQIDFQLKFHQGELGGKNRWGE